MTHRWIVTASGKDRPGIVAGVTKVLYTLGCNLEDSEMARLGGEFAIILLLSAPAKATESVLRKAFDPIAKRLGLVVHLKALRGAGETKSATGNPYILSVYGADRPGIVYRVAEALAAAGINITGVKTRRSRAGTGRKKPSLYLMLLEVDVPARVKAEALEQSLQRIGKKLGVAVSLHAADADIL